MKQCMLDNADVYDQFEEMMNSHSDMGYQQIMAQAMTLVPEYEDIIKILHSGNAAVKVEVSGEDLLTFSNEL